MHSWTTLSQAFGGIGIFILGMIIMTQGLHALAGDTIRNALIRFTKTPTTGVITGAVSTAVLQSSSATTVAAVGFVSAGLLTFPQALGIIFGANIGTTITGWMVALLGFKLKLGTLVLPFILVGSSLKLFSKGKAADIGFAIAGFGLIFVGISFMQEGMSVYKDIISPEYFPGDSFFGRFELFLLGILVTIITQSSSAGVAATLTMIYGGAISFEQGAALVVGMDVGTTVTAALATIGGSTEVKRTGFSHVVYNIFTGIAALFLIAPYTLFFESFAPGFFMQQAEIVLVLFHTFFNFLGVIAIIPFTIPFAHLMEKIIPEPKQKYIQDFDPALLENIPLALSVVQKSLENEFKTLLRYMLYLLGAKKNAHKINLHTFDKLLDETQNFLDKINLKNTQDANWQRLISLIHVIDHLQRLFDRCREDEHKALFLQSSPLLVLEKNQFIGLIQTSLQLLEKTSLQELANYTQQSNYDIDRKTEQKREEITLLMADGTVSIDEGTYHLEAIRWLQRSSVHITRIAYHLQQALLNAGK
ncbi:Na/Pi cotransporter family protein [Sulfurimonas hydrogeniphila]|uniref:Na/Pi cotransporter family protein n=1 Tax=Sulfurimonas hydrogeniphila TaxID=2509341 RepID=UPI00125FD90D|nr:Na/Pi symporter [Sulfurimonas hydrogeniphila]